MEATFLSFWVNPNTLWDTLLSWKGFLVGKKRKEKGKRSGKWDLYAYFGRCGRLGVGLFLRMGFFYVEGERETSFVYLLWSETKKTVLNGPPNIVGFIDWVKF